MVAYVRRNVAILTCVGAMGVCLLLIIFFGAWAVSASSGADWEGVLSGAASGFSGGVAPQSTDSETGAVAVAGDTTAPRLASASSVSAADTWWGKALLGACPLH